MEWHFSVYNYVKSHIYKIHFTKGEFKLAFYQIKRETLQTKIIWNIIIYKMLLGILLWYCCMKALAHLKEFW